MGVDRKSEFRFGEGYDPIPLDGGYLDVVLTLSPTGEFYTRENIKPDPGCFVVNDDKASVTITRDGLYSFECTLFSVQEKTGFEWNVGDRVGVKFRLEPADGDQFYRPLIVAETVVDTQLAADNYVNYLDAAKPAAPRNLKAGTVVRLAPSGKSQYEVAFGGLCIYPLAYYS